MIYSSIKSRKNEHKRGKTNTLTKESKMEILTTQEVAEMLQCEIKTARRYFRAGAIPGVRIGKEWRVRKETLQKFLEQKATQNTKGSENAVTKH